MTELVARPDLVPTDDSRPVTTEIVAVDGRLDDTDISGIVTLKEVDKTASAFLPFLAWEESADVWDPLWPDDVKRAAILAAPIIHRHKGTVYAVKAALGVLNIAATIVEWWDQTPRGVPYTFQVKAYARARLYDGPLLSPQLLSIAYASVLRAKPESRAFDFILGAHLPQSLGLAPVLAAKVRVARAAIPRPITNTRNALGLAAVLVGKVRVSRAVVPLLPAI